MDWEISLEKLKCQLLKKIVLNTTVVVLRRSVFTVAPSVAEAEKFCDFILCRTLVRRLALNVVLWLEGTAMKAVNAQNAEYSIK